MKPCKEDFITMYNKYKYYRDKSIEFANSYMSEFNKIHDIKVWDNAYIKECVDNCIKNNSKYDNKNRFIATDIIFNDEFIIFDIYDRYSIYSSTSNKISGYVNIPIDDFIRWLEVNE